MMELASFYLFESHRRWFTLHLDSSQSLLSLFVRQLDIIVRVKSISYVSAT